jgi:RNA polymerase sigma-70 factor (ECF subfamily)
MTPSQAQETLFESWLKDHAGILARVARSFARSQSELEDLRQEMMLQLWISTASFRTESAPSTWVYRVCLNTAITWHRGDSRRKSRIEPRADLNDVAGTLASPAENAGQREVIEQLYAAIHAMPDFDRALVLLMLDGVSYRDMAAIIGITETHVGVALTRARKRLAELMKGAIDEME